LQTYRRRRIQGRKLAHKIHGAAEGIGGGSEQSSEHAYKETNHQDWNPHNVNPKDNEGLWSSKQVDDQNRNIQDIDKKWTTEVH
jgi:hypothetical protein